VAKTDEALGRVRDLLAGSPEVEFYTYESQAEAYERFKVAFSDAPELVDVTRPDSLPASWRFRVRCAADFPAVRARLGAVHGVDVVCTCDPPETGKEPVAQRS
jgi:cell division transport system permease protein